MSYQSDLVKRKRMLEAKVKQAHLNVLADLKNKIDIIGSMQTLNNLRVDLETVKSRIKNYGKDVYLPEVQKIEI